ncbi:DUF1840 domain-containing protein [Thiomicrorhabdus aquaedulcis]|uniref:DUF1840 domain-containing protein n=1 Tax=Thiomicrorhabdus aquaedulcis TaxID=2211106 RepID=UPI000FD6B9CE|nr:DUF1840 family protein [Thiomicrorhabdus aquaedulcis]
MIRFKTKTHADVMMLEKEALKLVALMGLSDTLPNALAAEDVNAALEKLRQAATRDSATMNDAWSDKSVSLNHRAQPLIELLEAANTAKQHVIWEKSVF